MYEDLLETAVAAARAGAEIIGPYFRDAGLEVRRKGENDFVTQADKESEAAILADIRERFPDHRILAEEGSGAGEGHGDYEWLIDPLDGTTNFLQGLPVYCVSIACRRGDELLVGAIEDPEGKNLFTAVRGGGAFWNGRRMETSPRDGLKGAFLATGYPFRALPTLDIYLGIFRDVFLAVQGHPPLRLGGARPRLHGGRGLRRLLRVPALAVGHRRRHPDGARGRRHRHRPRRRRRLLRRAATSWRADRPCSASCSPSSSATAARRPSSRSIRSARRLRSPCSP